MWEEIAFGHTDGHRLTNYYIDFDFQNTQAEIRWMIINTTYIRWSDKIGLAELEVQWFD